MNGFQTANAHTGANGGRLSSANTDQRRWVSASAGIGKASTRPSRSTRSRQTGAGMIFESRRTVAEVAPAAEDCLLGQLSTDPSDPTKKVIKPGYITGGSAADILLQKDGISPVDGQKLYIKLNVTLNAEDGVMLNSFEMNSATIEQSATQPDDDSFDVDALTGDVYFIIGEWEDTSEAGEPESLAFLRDGCGSYRVKFCGGQAIMVRG